MYPSKENATCNDTNPTSSPEHVSFYRTVVDYSASSSNPFTFLYALRCISKKTNVQMVCLAN